MIELAPGDKHGLPVVNPVLVAGGTVGYGEIVPRGLDLARVGGAVVGPFTAGARSGKPPPRYAAGVGGLVLESGGQARGVQVAVKKFARLWPRLGCLVIAQIVGETAREIGKVAARLREAAGVAGFEVVPLTTTLDEARGMVAAAVQEGDLPVWAKLALPYARQWAESLVQAGARGLVIGQSPRGRLAAAGGEFVAGSLYGPLTFGLMLETLAQVAAQQLPASLIACGGIHTAGQMMTALAAGAQAVQVDSAIWVEPGLPIWLVEAWEAHRLEQR